MRRTFHALPTLMSLPRLLLVDDVPANLRALVDLLRDGYELQFATSGGDALTLLQADPKPDLILLDVMMPVMDGYAVCRELKRRPATQHIPVVFITALDAPHDEVLGLEVGAADYITKPFEPDVALARVRNQLRQKFAADGLRASASNTSTRAHNVFRQQGGVWELGFQGGTRIALRDMLGLQYLQYLLRHPQRFFSVEEIVFLASPRERERLFEHASTYLDEHSLRCYRLRTQQLLDEDAPENGGAVNAESIDRLLGELRRTGILASDTPRAIDARERLRKSIGNAIRRAIGEIANHDPALASHLQHPTLRMGYALVYAPTVSVTWCTSAEW
ncbi:response regulator [Candidatus Symbiobacter mobilis]|uniref:Response regulator n=1 Tax=Candidatus Symbiobacter mobilis CR TaxID=946483 RepID=U5N8V8_9BURK|nr:response regulator [Candidatus Symbiobacter mobilis]AGX87976.1 response regulator [Candidatus Symbiobacter mobilis CR]